MCRERNCREVKKTGRRVFTLISCLILLSGIGMLSLHMDEKKLKEGEDRAEVGAAEGIGEEEDTFMPPGDFDNSIDAFYLPVIFANGGEDKVTALESYENAWRGQLETYLEDYRSGCRYAKDKEMAEEYFAAVQMAVDAQKKLMEYVGVEAECQLWYSAQIYRYAFLKDVCGGGADDIDRQNAASMYEQSEADIRCRQEAFDLEWCNELGSLTMTFYENLDEEGRRLAGIWQQSRENWKAAADVRFWQTPEELNGQPEDAVLCGGEVNFDLMEKDGWINRLYCQQLNSMISVDDSPWQDIGREDGK